MPHSAASDLGLHCLFESVCPKILESIPKTWDCYVRIIHNTWDLYVRIYSQYLRFICWILYQILGVYMLEFIHNTWGLYVRIYT